MTNYHLLKNYDQMMELYTNIKRELELRARDGVKYRNDFERWKAGGYQIDENIVSSYPSLGELVENTKKEDEEADEELCEQV